jgi:hypothetical protein
MLDAQLVLPVTLVMAKKMDQRGSSRISLIGILPPTSLALGTQWRARYMPTCSGSALCPEKDTGTPLFERPVRKYTSSNLMVRSYVPIRNPCSATSHRPIMCSSNKILFFIFCNLKNFSKPQARNAAPVRGICIRKPSHQSHVLFLSTRSWSPKSPTKQKEERISLFQRLGNFSNFQKQSKNMEDNAHIV